MPGAQHESLSPTLVITLVVALVEIRGFDLAAHRGWIESHLSRKFIHIFTGPFFVLCWLLFPSPDLWYTAGWPRWFRCYFTVQFALIGLGLVKDEASVKAMSRSGDRRKSYGVRSFTASSLWS